MSLLLQITQHGLQKLSYLILILFWPTDWKKELKKIRIRLSFPAHGHNAKFCLPMNPPRVELEFAIRTCLKTWRK